MTKTVKKTFKESANNPKPVLELKLCYFSEFEAYNILINYLFDLEFNETGNPNNRKGILYKPGLYMEHYKPDLEVELTKETDKMYITIKGLDGNRQILMNPKFMDRINDPEMSNNHFEKAVINRSLIETCINSLREEFRAILFYFLMPTLTLESNGISKFWCDKINKKNRQNTRVKRLKEATNHLVNSIVMIQEGLR